MSGDGAPGADTVNAGTGQAGVDSKLISNRTVLVRALNEKRSKASDKVEVVDVPDVAAAVKALGPEAEFHLQDARLGEGGKVEVSEVAVTMTYGADNAARVVEDFSPEALAGKAVAEAGNEVERRLLLRQRLQSQVIEQLVAKLKDPKFAAQLDDPAARKAILAELDTRIAEIERIKAEIEIAGLDGNS